MRVLVLGGTHFIGRALVGRLLERGDEVTVLTRGGTNDPFGERIQRLACDRRERARFRGLVSGTGSWDAVFDSSARRPERTRDAIAALIGRVDHFVHLSTATVYEVLDSDREGPYVEADILFPTMSRLPGQDPEREYGIKKRACETALWEAHRRDGFPMTCLRPPIVLGPWDHTCRSWRYQLWLQSETPVELPEGGTQRHALAFVDDVVEAILICFDHPAASIGQAFNIAQEETPSLREFLEQMAAAIGHEARFVDVPFQDYLLGERDRAWQPFVHWSGGDFVLDLTKARRTLGWRATPMSDWLPRTCAWFDGPENRFGVPKDPPWLAVR